jgi:hypothetical protein
VGIGTTAPLNNFEVYNNGGVGGTTQANITSWAGGSTTTNTAALNLRVQGAGGGNVDNIISGQYNSSGAGTYSLALKPGGTTTMTIVASGNVGIGTALPSAPLHVYSSGGISLATTGTVNYTNSSILGFGFGGGSSGTRDSFRIISQAVNRDSGAGPYYDYGVQADLIFQRKTNNLYASAANDITYTEAMRISGTTGNVGIGTASPSAQLQITNANMGRLTGIYVGPSTQSGIVLDSTSGASGRSFNIWSTSSGDSMGAGSLAFFDITASVYRMVINSSGNVGIGLTNPGYKLDVSGNVNFGANDSTSGSRIYLNGTNACIQGGPSGSDLIHLVSGNGTKALSVAYGGNIGINNTNPADKIDVVGGVKANGGFYSYNTSFSYYGGNATWNPGDPTGWPFGGNVFLVTFKGNTGTAGNAVRAAFIVFHSRWGAGNNNYGQITALSNSWVSSWSITDGGLSFTFNSPSAHTVYINFLVLN